MKPSDVRVNASDVGSSCVDAATERDVYEMIK